MKLELNENDMMLATIAFLAGTIAVIALKQLEMINVDVQQQSMQYAPQPYNVPLLRKQAPPLRIAKQTREPKPVENTVSNTETVQETHAAELSPVTFLGYNTNDDLVSVMKRMPNGEVMRRKIRDPDMSIGNLSVDRWVEYNDWEKEYDMDWI